MPTRKYSLLETAAESVYAFCVSVLVFEFIVKPAWGINTAFTDNLSITSLFTAVGFMSSYGWRRFWNWLDNKNKKAANHETGRNHREGRCGEGHVR